MHRSDYACSPLRIHTAYTAHHPSSLVHPRCQHHVEQHRELVIAGCVYGVQPYDGFSREDMISLGMPLDDIASWCIPFYPHTPSYK